MQMRIFHAKFEKVKFDASQMGKVRDEKFINVDDLWKSSKSLEFNETIENQ